MVYLPLPMLKNTWSQLEIRDAVSLEDYVNVDSSVSVSGKPSDDDVVTEVRQKRNAETDPTYDEEEEDEETPSTPAQPRPFTDVLESLSCLSDHGVSKKLGDIFSDRLAELTDIIMAKRYQALKQSKITEFVKDS